MRGVRVVELWLVAAALVVAAGLVQAGAGCTEVTGTCGLATDCEACVRDGACAWCLETGQCLVSDTHCPGERATTLEACEAEHP